MSPVQGRPCSQLDNLADNSPLHVRNDFQVAVDHELHASWREEDAAARSLAMATSKSAFALTPSDVWCFSRMNATARAFLWPANRQNYRLQLKERLKLLSERDPTVAVPCQD